MDVSLGVGMCSEEVTAGSILVNLEGEKPMSGWLWRRRVVVTENTRDTFRAMADIRSQRKLMYGEPRLFIGYNLNQGAAFTVGVTGLIRSLYLMA